MSYHESLGNSGEAGQDQLADLYEDTLLWLGKNVPVSLSPKEKVLGLYEGLPIAKDGPRMDFTCYGNQIYEVVPEASEFFEDSDELTITYFLPFYTPAKNDFDGPEYCPASIVFYIARDSKPKYKVWLDIEKSDDDVFEEYQIDRFIEAHESLFDNNPGNLPFFPDDFDQDGDSQSLLRHDEYRVISKIVKNIDQIKDLKEPEAPLYVDFSA